MAEIYNMAGERLSDPTAVSTSDFQAVAGQYPLLSDYVLAQRRAQGYGMSDFGERRAMLDRGGR